MIKSLINVGIFAVLSLNYTTLESKSVNVNYNNGKFEKTQLTNINSSDTLRYLLGKKLWEGDIENGILGQPWPHPSFGQRNIWQKPNEVSGPGGTYSDIVSESPAFGKTGKKAIKMQINLTPPNTKAGIRHFDDDRINDNPDHILTSWYYVPQLITDVGWGVMVMQWKQLTDNWTGSYHYSHANVGVYIYSRNGQNYLNAQWLESFWRSGGRPHGGSHATKNIPIGEWFGIKARYIKSSPGVPNGRFTVWQIDLDGTHHLIADHQNIVTYWDKDENNHNARGRQLRAGIAWYAEKVEPSIITAYADDPTIHLPKEIGEQPEPTYNLKLQVMPSSDGSVKNHTGGNNYNEHAKVNLEALPQKGFEFVNWTLEGKVIGTETKINYTMPNKNITLVANFKNKLYNVEIKISSPEGGKVKIKKDN